MKSSSNSKYNFIKAILFVTLALVVMGITFSYCSIKDDVYSYEVWEDFYGLPKDTVNLILIGGSGIREYYIAPEAYMYSGISSYALATGNQPFAATKYLIEEARKTQKPQVFIIDIRNLIYDDFNDAAIRRVTDGMKHSKNRFVLINTLVNRSEVNNKRINIDNFDYYFKFPMYHTQWEELSKGKRVKSDKVWMGFNIYDNVEAFDKVTLDILETTPVPISEHNEEVLYDFLNYCNSIDERVLFINVPSVYEEKDFGKFNYIKKIIDEAGFEVLDLNYYTDEMSLDYEYDFKNFYHVNVWGAVKVTDYISDWCRDKYNLPDHSGDAKYSMWEENYYNFMQEFNKLNSNRMK